MTDPGALGAFLLARRAQLQPQDVGLRTYGDRRRVRGLRREEVAQLAGVGMSYYTRLEQGQSTNASPEVLDALADALLLDDTARAHLHTLAGARRSPVRPRQAAERVSPETQQLLTALGDAPAVVLGRCTDVLAWNATGHALFAGHLDLDAPARAASRPTMARLVFLDPRTRELYADWSVKASAVVGNLRLTVGRHPGDAALESLVGELTIRSPEFAAMWADHRVRDCDVNVFTMRHPVVGVMRVAQQSLPVPLAPDQRLVVATAAPGSDAAVSLALLAQTAAFPPAREPDPAQSGRVERFAG